MFWYPSCCRGGCGPEMFRDASCHVRGLSCYSSAWAPIFFLPFAVLLQRSVAKLRCSPASDDAPIQSHTAWAWSGSVRLLTTTWPSENRICCALLLSGPLVCFPVKTVACDQSVLDEGFCLIIMYRMLPPCPFWEWQTMFGAQKI